MRIDFRQIKPSRPQIAGRHLVNSIGRDSYLDDRRVAASSRLLGRSTTAQCQEKHHANNEPRHGAQLGHVSRLDGRGLEHRHQERRRQMIKAAPPRRPARSTAPPPTANTRPSFRPLSSWVVPDTTVRLGVPRRIGSAVTFATKTAGEGVADGVRTTLTVGVADDALVGVRVAIAAAGGAVTAGCVAAGGAIGAAAPGKRVGVANCGDVMGVTVGDPAARVTVGWPGAKVAVRVGVLPGVGVFWNWRVAVGTSVGKSVAGGSGVHVRVGVGDGPGVAVLVAVGVAVGVNVGSP